MAAKIKAELLDKGEIGAIYAYKKVPSFKVRIEIDSIQLLLNKDIFSNMDDWEKINDEEVIELNLN